MEDDSNKRVECLPNHEVIESSHVKNSLVGFTTKMFKKIFLGNTRTKKPSITVSWRKGRSTNSMCININISSK